MKILSKTDAVILATIALLWAIFNPLLLPALNAGTFYYHGMPGLLHTMAQDLRAALPKEPTSDTALVSLPAQRVSKTADVMDEVAKNINNVSPGDAFNMISSVAIIVLSVCIFVTSRRDGNVTA
jgi:hypothetical protein